MLYFSTLLRLFVHIFHSIYDYNLIAEMPTLIQSPLSRTLIYIIPTLGAHKIYLYEFIIFKRYNMIHFFLSFSFFLY